MVGEGWANPSPFLHSTIFHKKLYLCNLLRGLLLRKIHSLLNPVGKVSVYILCSAKLQKIRNDSKPAFLKTVGQIRHSQGL